MPDLAGGLGAGVEAVGEEGAGVGVVVGEEEAGLGGVEGKEGGQGVEEVGEVAGWETAAGGEGRHDVAESARDILLRVTAWRGAIGGATSLSWRRRMKRCISSMSEERMPRRDEKSSE